MRREDPQIRDLKENNPIRRLRRKLGMTQAELAAAMDVSYQLVTAIENGYVRKVTPALSRGLARLGLDTIALNRDYLAWRAQYTERILATPALALK